jgi:hypothetical protein
MSRLYDRILLGGKTYPWGVKDGHISQLDTPSVFWPEEIAGSVVVNAQNVCDYFFSNLTQLSGKPLQDIAPHCIPPWKQVFVEFAPPKGAVCSKQLLDLSGFAKSFGCWIGLHDKDTAALTGKHWGSEEIEILCTIKPFIETERNTIRDWPFYMWGLDSNGKMILCSRNYEDAEERDIVSWIEHFTSVCMLAMSFCNCKNVVIVDNHPHTAKKILRRGDPPRVSYKTLQIEPIKRILETEGQALTHGLNHALHICRGHFKTYSGDKKLFGRVEGTFWWSPTVRGDKKNGEVIKDYKVASPLA